MALIRCCYSSEALTHPSITHTHTHTLYIFTPSVFIKVSAFAHTRSGPLEKHSNNAVGLSTRADIFYCSSSVSACLELDSFLGVSAQVRGWKRTVMCSFRSVSILIRRKQNSPFDIVGTVYHLVIYMQSNKIHKVF